jgi:uncharacterized membrane protein YcaP (DUF421 family)
MSMRAAIVFALTLTYVRLGNKRFLGRRSAFDFVLAIILGSVMSRAINGQAPFGPTLAAGAALLGLHWMLGAMALRWPALGSLVKGRPRLLVKDGRFIEEEARKSHISETELLEDLRSEAHIDSIEDVQAAYLECNGKIGVVMRDPSRQRTLSRGPPQD